MILLLSIYRFDIFFKCHSIGFDKIVVGLVISSCYLSSSVKMGTKV